MTELEETLKFIMGSPVLSFYKTHIKLSACPRSQSQLVAERDISVALTGH